MTTTATTATERQDDTQCQHTANAFLTSLLGATPNDLRWDATHHLRGHLRCAGRDIVVIAARDTAHHATILTAEDWDAIRLAPSVDRATLLRDCSIDSHDRLVPAPPRTL